MNLARVLIVDDDSDAVLSLSRALKAAGLEAQISGVSTVAKGRDEFQKLKPQVAVLDLSIDPKLGPESGLALLRELSALGASCRFIVLTGHSDDSFGVRALQAGAASFLAKPADIPLLLALIRDGIAQSVLRESFKLLQSDRKDEALSRFVGIGPKTSAVRESLLFAASNTLPVLLVGETGTGKGIAAQIVHDLSARAPYRFVRYQTSFGGNDLVNSELFGHVKGAFTGAESDRRGLLEEARGGTLFLDEIEALPESTQVALLGVLQERKFRRLGSNEEREVDVRLVCATNQDPEAAQRSGKLRSDFYHRVAHLTIVIPPLRERSADILPLANHFIEELNRREGTTVLHLEQAAENALLDREWRGNVRELQSIVQAGALRARFHGRNILAVSDLAPAVSGTISAAELSFHDRVETYKQKLIEEALAECDGNQVQAAKFLGLDRSTLRRIHGRG